MPDISKINALAIGSVSKVDGLAKASILDIDGVAVPSGFLLDTYTGAEAAYSVRLLRTAYTGSCMRVREDGGNTETDIGFDGSGNLDTAAIASHCGSNNGFIRYWYDQSGNANDAGQATAGSQPQIYNGTAVLDYVTNSGATHLETSLAIPTSNTNGYIFVTGQASAPFVAIASSANGTWCGYGNNGDTSVQVSQSWDGPPDFYDKGTLITSVNRDKIYDAIGTKGLLTIENTGVNTTVNYELSYGAHGSAFDGLDFAEVLIWHSTQSTTDREGIETDIKTYFSIT